MSDGIDKELLEKLTMIFRTSAAAYQKLLKDGELPPSHLESAAGMGSAAAQSAQALIALSAHHKQAGALKFTN